MTCKRYFLFQRQICRTSKFLIHSTSHIETNTERHNPEDWAIHFPLRLACSSPKQQLCSWETHDLLLLLWFLVCGLTLSGVTFTSLSPSFLTLCSHSDFSVHPHICCKVLLGKRQGNPERWRFSSHSRVDWKTFLCWQRNTNWLSVNSSVHLLLAECWGSSNKNRSKVFVWSSWTEQAFENTLEAPLLSVHVFATVAFEMD